eukprot:s345_g33.t1
MAELARAVAHAASAAADAARAGTQASTSSSEKKSKDWHADGKQAGGLSHRAALPLLLPFCQIGTLSLPTEQPAVTYTVCSLPACNIQGGFETLAYQSTGHAKGAQQTVDSESGGEDWSDTYRHSPISRHESLGCVVAWWHHEWQEPAFQLYKSLLFGLPLAVTSFNRYSRWVESLGRRLLACMVSMYFEDANLVDWASSQGSSPQAFCQLHALLGTPLAADKHQPMSSQGLFFGLEPRQRLLD